MPAAMGRADVRSRGLPLPECLGASRSRGRATTRHVLDPRGRTHERCHRPATRERIRFRAARHGLREHQLPAGTLRVLRSSGPHCRERGRWTSWQLRDHGPDRRSRMGTRQHRRIRRRPRERDNLRDVGGRGFGPSPDDRTTRKRDLFSPGDQRIGLRVDSTARCCPICR